MLDQSSLDRFNVRVKVAAARHASDFIFKIPIRFFRWEFVAKEPEEC